MLPQDTVLARLSLEGLRALALRLQAGYGTQTAGSLLRILRVAQRRTADDPDDARGFDPLDAAWAAQDAWHIDAARYQAAPPDGLPGPAAFPFGYGIHDPGEKQAQFGAGVRDGRSALAARDNARLRLAIWQHGGAAVLDAIWLEVCRHNHMDHADRDQIPAWAPPGIAGLR